MDNFLCITAIHRAKLVEKSRFSQKYREKSVDNCVDNVDYSMAGLRQVLQKL